MTAGCDSTSTSGSIMFIPGRTSAAISVLVSRGDRRLGVAQRTTLWHHHRGPLERSDVIDLLPNRDADTVAAWLKAPPGVEAVGRDRSQTYARAATEGA